MLPNPLPNILHKKELTEFLYPRDKNYPLTESWEVGGEYLNNVGEGLLKYTWFAWTDNENIYIKREDLDNVIKVLSDIDITEIDVTFDQNMNICVAYVSNNISKLYWYDAQQSKQVTTIYPVNIKRPRVSLDDKRAFNISSSDIIFGYQRDEHLCYRLQRDRYSKEYIIATDLKVKRILWRIGMGRDNRFLFFWR